MFAVVLHPMTTPGIPAWPASVGHTPVAENASVMITQAAPAGAVSGLRVRDCVLSQHITDHYSQRPSQAPSRYVVLQRPRGQESQYDVHVVCANMACKMAMQVAVLLFDASLVHQEQPSVHMPHCLT